MMSWAKVIDSFENVPEIYKTSYRALLGDSVVVPYTVLAPIQDSPWSGKAKERLLCEINDTFYVLERTGAKIITTAYRYQDIDSLELGNILIYSWFSISGMTNTGIETALTVEFNEATLRHFEPFFGKMRPAPADSDLSRLKVEQAKFDHLSTENFKFMNFARASLVPGERVIHSCYQPPKRQNLMTVLGRSFYRNIFLAHLTVLTDQEVILISDNERAIGNKGNRYGGVRRYIPLRRLASVAIEEHSKDLLRFTFQLSPNSQVIRFFDSANLVQAETLKKVIDSLLA
ncbi:MAG: hypothetical protein NT121_14045 [Chloroflexi bacterium]|nr:hypothetical protein [Chloroflexota bacterium]